MARLPRALLAVTGLVALLVGASPAAAHDPEGEHAQESATFGPDLMSPNMRLLANLPLRNRPENVSVAGSDLAFWGDRAYAGNYGGFRILDVSRPANPRELADVRCFGPQNDVSVWRNRLLFLSVDAPQTTEECEGSRTTTWAQTPDAFEGIRIFDVSDPRDPELVGAVHTDCGSHTHTLVPDLANGRLLIYVSSYMLGATAEGPDCPLPTPEQPVSHDKISIVEVPLDRPQDAEVINEPRMDPSGEVCTPSTSNPRFPSDQSYICDPENDESRPFASRGCHDIQVFLDRNLAACSALAEGQLWDISDREQPRLLKRVDNPNVEFFHNAVFTWDGRLVVFSDEAGGGGEPWCREGDPDTVGANWYFPVAGDGAEAVGHYKIPRTTTGTCTAHNGNIVPVAGRYLHVQAWYAGGTSVSDFTDPAQPREIAYFVAGDPNPDDTVATASDAWSSYWYRRFIHVNDINRGYDALYFRDPARRQAPRLAYDNPQTQVGGLTGG